MLDIPAYPPVARGDHVDIYKSSEKGTIEVPDPYRWLEDITSEDTRAFIELQSAFTEAYLAEYSKRNELKKALEARWTYPKCSYATIL